MSVLAAQLDAALERLREDTEPVDLTLAQAARIMREATKDKSYQRTPLGEEAATYLRIKRKRLTESSHRDYERGLAHFCWHFADLYGRTGRSRIWPAAGCTARTVRRSISRSDRQG